MRLRDQLREWREAAGLTQGELAAAVGVKQQTVSDWEKGDARPQVNRAGAIASALGVQQSAVLAAMADSDEAVVEISLHSKIDRLNHRDRQAIEAAVDRLLGEES